MVHILARITFLPEAAERAAELLKELVAQSRQEPGCISYMLYRQSEHPHVFQTVERWIDQAAVDAHMGSAHIGRALSEATPLFAAAPEILPYDQLD